MCNNKWTYWFNFKKNVAKVKLLKLDNLVLKNCVICMNS